jgi:hypothetical protein
VTRYVQIEARNAGDFPHESSQSFQLVRRTGARVILEACVPIASLRTGCEGSNDLDSPLKGGLSGTNFVNQQLRGSLFEKRDRLALSFMQNARQGAND